MENWLLEECKKKIECEKIFVRNFRENDYHWEIGINTAFRIASETGTPVSVGDILHGIRVGRITFDPLKYNLFILRRNDELTATGFLVEMEDETMKKQITPYNLMCKPKTPKQMTMNMIRNVIFNDPATIVIWADGTKTVVKADRERFDPEKGLAMAISKKLFGNKGYYYDIFKRWLPKEKETKYTGTNEWSERELIKEDIKTITFKNGKGLWMVDKKYSKKFIRDTERYLNDRLRALGWISLNEVYDLLGIPRVLEAQIVGWKISDKLTDDNCIKFEFDEIDNNQNIVVKFKNMVTLL